VQPGSPQQRLGGSDGDVGTRNEVILLGEPASDTDGSRDGSCSRS